MKNRRNKEAAVKTESLLTEVTIQGSTNNIQAIDILFIEQYFSKI